MLAQGHEVGDVTQCQTVVSARDDGVVTSLDGYDVVGCVGAAQFVQRLVEHACCLAQFDAQHHQCAAMHLPVLSHARTLDAVQDFLGSQCLGVDDAVYAHLLEEFSVLGTRVFGIVHACHRLAAAQCVGQHTACDVAGLFGCDTDEEVCVGHPCLLESADARG